MLEYPIYSLAFDSAGRLWGATGGGPARADSQTGAVLQRIGNGLTMAPAIHPSTNEIYVSSGSGVEIYNSATGAFRHFSRSTNLRVGSLAFDNSGALWAATWPDRTQVVPFSAKLREVRFAFDDDIDSLAFGVLAPSWKACCSFRTIAGRNESGSDLTMIDLATGQA